MNQETLNMLVTIVFIPLLAALVPAVILALNAWVRQTKTKIADASLHKYVDIAEDAIATAVISTYQTFVSSVKGTEGWTPEIQKMAFKEAKLKALAIMGTATREALEAIYSDFDAWIDNKIEVAVSATP